jgi:Prolyl-tRNA synthetase
MDIDQLIDARYSLDGFYIRKPMFVRTQRIIENQLFDFLEREDYLPVLFPTLIPKEVIEKEVHHIAGFEPAVYWVESYGVEKKMNPKAALAISSETVFCQTFANWIKEGENVPLQYYQNKSVFRAENKELLPLIREREFMWIEAHTAFNSTEECYARMMKDIEIVRKFCGLYNINITVEEREEKEKCPGAITTFGIDVAVDNIGKVQIASTHYLGDRFSRAFDLKKDKYLFQTSFGIGISRIIGVLYYYGKLNN